MIRRALGIPYRASYIPRTVSFGSRRTIYMGDNTVNFYSGQPPLNRLSFQRPAADKINAHLENPEARFLCFRELKPLVKKSSPSELLLLRKDELEDHLGAAFQSPPDTAIEKDDRRIYESARLPHTLPALVFLGIDDRPGATTPADLINPKGTPYFALDAPGDWEVPNGEWAEARAAASSMSGWEAGLFAQGRALVDWNMRNKFCAACGQPTYSLWAGWKRGCLSAIHPVKDREACFSLKGLHNFAYPRTDCVVIMGILNPGGDKILLGRQKSWPKGMYSCLAGFMEPGESLEDSVRREVMEEAGLVVGDVRYSSSQPWPYPANLMIGCYGSAEDGQAIRMDLDNELEDAQWFSRDAISALIGTSKGSYLSKADLRQLDQKTSDQETANALAPSERKPGEGEGGEAKGLTRVPPATAIAGQLIRLWAMGGLESSSKL